MRNERGRQLIYIIASFDINFCQFCTGIGVKSNFEVAMVNWCPPFAFDCNTNLVDLNATGACKVFRQ